MNHNSTAKLRTREADLTGRLDGRGDPVRGRRGLRMLRLFVAMLAGIAVSVVGCPAAVAQTSPVITSASPPNGVVGNGYLHLFQASAHLPDPVFVVTAGSLPPGMLLQPSGFVTGAASGAGSFGPTTVCGVDEPAAPACQTFTIEIWKRRPAVLAAPSAGGNVGTPVRETASLVGGVNPTGWVTFRLFNDVACTVEVFRSTNALSSGSATSTDFTPTAPGTYRWTTTYSGDANHELVSTPCDPSNSVVITTSSTTTTVPRATTTIAPTTTVPRATTTIAPTTTVPRATTTTAPTTTVPDSWALWTWWFDR